MLLLISLYGNFFSKITDPPTLQSIPDQNKTVGETLSITCQISSANPLPNQYKWTKVGGGTINQTGPLLTIPTIQRRHAGTYRCTAVNTMVPTTGSRQQGIGTKDITVNVMCKYMHHISNTLPNECTWLNIGCRMFSRTGQISHRTTESNTLIGNITLVMDSNTVHWN